MTRFRRAVYNYLAGRDYDSIALVEGLYRVLKWLVIVVVAGVIVAALILDPPLGLTYLGLIILAVLPALVRRINQWRRR